MMKLVENRQQINSHAASAWVSGFSWALAGRLGFGTCQCVGASEMKPSPCDLLYLPARSQSGSASLFPLSSTQTHMDINVQTHTHTHEKAPREPLSVLIPILINP